jgi:hypothetical protein
MSITFGSSSAPSQIITYLDSVFGTSLSFWNKKLVDQIGATNAFLNTLLKSEFYEAYEGGTDIRQPLMYELVSPDWYDGYDELPLAPIDGITDAVFQASQYAAPIQYSMKEVINNRQRIVDLVDTKMTQLEMGIAEGFAGAIMNGAGSGALLTPQTGATGATGIDPIAKLVDFVPSGARSVGNIAQDTYTWWRNLTATSAATTYDGLLSELNHMYNSCSLGSGGAPDILLVDQITYELMSFALWNKYRQTGSDVNFSFTNMKLPFGNGKCKMVMDDKVHDIYSNVTSAATYGSAYFLNTQFARIRYIAERDFKMLTNESGKTFVKPPRGDSRLGHMAWMGAVTITNRRKFGVVGKIARTLT